MMNPPKLSITALITDLRRALLALDLDVWAIDKACREVGLATEDDPSSWRYQTNLDLARRRYNADLKRVRVLTERLFRAKKNSMEKIKRRDKR